MADRKLTASGYLVLRGKRTWGPTNPETGLVDVSEMRIVAFRKEQPQGLEADDVVIRIKIEMPNRIFDPLRPAAVITVDDEALIAARGAAEIRAVVDSGDE